MPNTATQKQIDFINTLKSQRDLSEAANVLEMARNLWRIEAFTTQAASTVIDALKGLPFAQAPAMPSTPEGMHVYKGQVCKVQMAKNGSGNLYAKILGHDGDFEWYFRYEPGLIKFLSAETVMSAEEAAKFGATYGICCNCSRDLTDERSIKAGYGPKCAANNGWPWG